MTDRELMQMALDALLTMTKPVANAMDGHSFLACADAVEALRERLAQPEQEPAAWIITTELQDGTRLTHPLTGRFKDVQDRCDFGDPIPLYTAPPQREWQGMTDEEIFECENGVPDEAIGDADYFRYFARAIEAKLKEKNS